MSAPLRRLRVLTLIDKTRMGGAERFAVALANGLDRHRFEPILCTTRPGEPLETLGVPGGPVRRLELNRRSAMSLHAWTPLVRLVRREGVDVIHAHMHGSNLWATVLGRALRVPVVIATEHTWSFEGQPMRKALDRHVVGRFASVFASISAADHRRMIEIVRVPPAKARLMPLGLVPRAEEDHGQTLREELGIGATAPVIGAVSMLRPQKALDVMLAAFALIRRRRADARLLIAGYGWERDRLEALAGELGLGSSVTFLGNRPDIRRVLAAFDVYAQSSDFEGTPIAVLEAMSAARPIVATAVGGTPGLLDGGSGVLVPPRDPDALAAAVEKLLDNPELGRSLGARARARVDDVYAFERVIERWQELYVELFDRSAASRRARRG